MLLLLLCERDRTYLPCTLFHSTSSVSSVVLIMSVFDLQLSLSQRDPSQHETLPTTPRCVFKSEAEAATESERREEVETK